MPETQITQEEGRIIRLIRNSFRAAGQDSFSKAPAQNPDMFEKLENFLPFIDGPLRKRWGMSRFDDNVSPVAIAPQIISEYRNDAGTTRRLILSGSDGATRKVKSCDASGVVQNVAIWTVASLTDDPRSVMSRDFAYFASGSANDSVKWDGNDTSGSGATTWGFVASTTTPSASASGTGNITINDFRDYTVAFENTTTGHISNIAIDGNGDFVFTRVEAFTDKAQVDLTSVPTGAATIGGVNTGINQRVILATSDGGPRTILYKVGVIANNSATTFTDTLKEADLIVRNLYVEIGDDGLPRGIKGNQRPPATGKFPIKHRGRMFLLDGSTLHFSKSLDEVSTSTTFEIGGRWEECWPPEFQMDVSSVAQNPIGLLSDGFELYILAQSGLYRLRGDGPLNYRPPELVFRFAGIESQDSVDIVYREGQPVGFVWVTPDRQIVFSDGNTYRNLTWPVKTEMDDIPVADKTNIRVKYGSFQGYNLCFVAVPQTGKSIPEKLLVLNLDTSTWSQFTFPTTQKVTALYFWNNPITNLPQIIWGIDADKMYEFDETKDQDLDSSDVAASFTANADGSWLDFGSPQYRKFLNDFEVSGQIADIAVTIDGASTSAEFDSPFSVISGETPIASPFGEGKVALAGKTTKDRFYRIKLAVTADVLFSVAAVRAIGMQAVLLHTI